MDYILEEDNLEMIVRKGMVKMGGPWPTDLDLFVEGDPEDADLPEDEDHWSNIRPY